MEETLDQLGHQDFHQIPMNPVHALKTASSTPSGHYEFTRIPFGLKNAPSSFQRMMKNVLTGLTNK